MLLFKLFTHCFLPLLRINFAIYGLLVLLQQIVFVQCSPLIYLILEATNDTHFVDICLRFLDDTKVLLQSLAEVRSRAYETGRAHLASRSRDLRILGL